MPAGGAPSATSNISKISNIQLGTIAYDQLAAIAENLLDLSSNSLQNLSMQTTEKKSKLPPARIVRGLNNIRNGMMKITRKMVPPPVALLDMLSGMWIAQSIGTIARMGIADHFSGTATSVAEIAAKAKVNPDALYRVLRALSVVGVVRERDGKRFELTAIGQCMRTDHPQSMRFMAAYQTDLNWAHWGKLDHCLMTGTNAVEFVRGMKPFEYLSKNPKDAETFDRAMVNISKMEVDAILAAYDFSSFQTMADIGGGYGTFLAEVLHANPKAMGILYDMPHVVKGSSEYLNKEKLTDRVRIEGGSFFESVPAGADLYMMKHIIHDWSDELSLKILKNIRSKIPATGKLLLFEAVVPEPNEPDFSKFLDLEMLVVTEGGRERTEAEFRTLLALAGFTLEKVVPTTSMAKVIEARPASV